MIGAELLHHWNISKRYLYIIKSQITCKFNLLKKENKFANFIAGADIRARLKCSAINSISIHLVIALF